MIRRALRCVALVLSFALLMSCTGNRDAQMQEFLDEHVQVIQPLYHQQNLAEWEAYTTGKEEAYDRASELTKKIDEVYADREAYTHLKSMYDEGSVQDEALSRQLELLIAEYTRRQGDPELLSQLTDLSSSTQKAFAAHRGKIGGREVTDNDISSVLKNSIESGELHAAWEASKSSGRAVADDLRQLARLRNQLAQSLGFANFQRMTLALDEQDPDSLDRLFDELDELTRAPFMAYKAELDAALASQHDIAAEELRPWHYQDTFFQSPPSTDAVDLDVYAADSDPLEIARAYFSGLDLPLDDVLANSDLYERDGKNQHAYCFDIDRGDDVRILANVRPDYRWITTLMHEGGHAVYDLGIDDQLPYLLRTASHALVTEGYAMMMERPASDPQWLAATLDIDVQEAQRLQQALAQRYRAEKLVFARWCQVMYRFEKALYEDPEADLNEIWWGLVERYQGLTRPAGRVGDDWATKIHVITHPVYYHNYMLGELFSAQLYTALAEGVGKDPAHAAQVLVGNPDAGRWLTDQVFRPGTRYRWDDLTRRATGRALEARDFAAQFGASSS